MSEGKQKLSFWAGALMAASIVLCFWLFIIDPLNKPDIFPGFWIAMIAALCASIVIDIKAPYKENKNRFCLLKSIVVILWAASYFLW